MEANYELAMVTSNLAETQVSAEAKSKFDELVKKFQILSQKKN